MPAADCPAPPAVEEEILSAEEYLLLTTAALTAEHPTPFAISTFLTPAHDPTLSARFPKILLTLRPRPQFPPPLHTALLTHSVHDASAAPPPHEDLRFELHALTQVRDLCHACGLDVELPPALVDTVTHLAEARPGAPTEADVAAALDSSLWPQLHPFQRTGVLRAVCERQGCVLFADDMGLGKTVQALAVAEYFRWAGGAADPRVAHRAEPAPVLIICPATLRDAWRSAVFRWIPHTDPAAVHVVAKVKDFERLVASRCKKRRDPWDDLSRIAFVIVAYDLLSKVAPLQGGDVVSADMRFPIVVADECHTLRNKDTARTRATLPLFLSAERRILISGTPVLSRPSEVYPLLSAILNSEKRPFLGYEEFLERYCGGQSGIGRAITYADELNLLLSAVMIRRAKAEVQHKLPPKVRRHVVIEVPDSLLQPLLKMRMDLDKLTDQIRSQSADQHSRIELRSRRKALCSSLAHKTAYLKIPGVVTRLQNLIRDKGGPKKFLVFAHHLHVLDAVETLAIRENASYLRIDGETDASKRQEMVESFQNEPELRIAILSLAVAGTGLTLTAADLVVFAELSWVPSVLGQAEDRAHRLGRVGRVMVEYIFAPGTADDLMWSAVKGKLDMLNKAVDGSQLKRKEAFDVSSHCGKRICISEVDVQSVVTDAIRSIETSGDDQTCLPAGNNDVP